MEMDGLSLGVGQILSQTLDRSHTSSKPPSTPQVIVMVVVVEVSH